MSHLSFRSKQLKCKLLTFRSYKRKVPKHHTPVLLANGQLVSTLHNDHIADEGIYVLEIDDKTTMCADEIIMA